ncbi:MAG: hypothetical protein UW70_C0013G0002 [Candidatus Peregrinibacteria bacterium GW2011_GWA2_44_7]|nr:MAG: hypothetical protein UW70_C0013G0002 [Candidatus Peregrinibacteria bacterium GW2011_GWA2_44_7]
MFEKIKKIFTSESANHKKEKDYLINPDKDWRIILSVFFALNLVLFFYLFLTFRNLINESAFDTAQTIAQPQILDEKSLEKVLEIYSNREERTNILLKGAPTSTDPAI